MKTEFTDIGWKETATTHINLRKPFPVAGNPFLSVQKWIDFNKRHPKIGRKRKTCNCCKKTWESIPDGNINIVFTDKGNKAICDECYERLKNLNL